MIPNSNYLNLGCGARFNTEWDNVNFTASGPHVIAWDLNKGIPFPNNSFSVVYHSHLLEHFPKTKAKEFLMECQRVLKPQGIIRIVVPDLEQIVLMYLKTLESAVNGSLCDIAHYEWMLLEMYDQAVRNSSGGEMEKYLMQEIIKNEDFIVARCGIEACNTRKNLQHGQTDKSANKANIPHEAPVFIKYIQKLKRIPLVIREKIIKAVLGNEYESLNIGRFRLSGEIHQWMYDRYSLCNILNSCGFADVVQRSAADSYIPHWSSFNLDTALDGSIYKPDSLFMEAIKP